MAERPDCQDASDLTERGQVVESFWNAVDRGTSGLGTIPALIKRILQTEAWRKRIHKGRVYEHNSFLSFLTTKPFAGCGYDPTQIERLIKDDAETLAMWREAVIPGPGRPSANRSIPTNNDRGKGYIASRLKRDAPELFRRVVAGELSANAAAIEAGFRKKPTPFATVCKLIPKLTDDERDQVRGMLE